MPSYVINTQHRDRNPNKSQWTVAETDERSLFNVAISEWLEISSNNAYGIKKTGASLDVLGICVDRTTNLKIAKFKGDQDVWHGYPANYRINQHDKPSPTILEKWKQAELISKSDMAKISRGQKCNL